LQDGAALSHIMLVQPTVVRRPDSKEESDLDGHGVAGYGIMAR
jgi:hypothetical protein